MGIIMLLFWSVAAVPPPRRSAGLFVNTFIKTSRELNRQ